MYHVIEQSLKKRLLITANFCHLHGLWLKGCLKMHFLQVECKSLWLKGCLKMHFLQVECKSLSRLGVNPDLQLREAKLCNGGLGAEAPKGSRSKAPGQGSER